MACTRGSVDDMEFVLNSQEMYGFDIHNASNRMIYEVAFGKYLQENTGHQSYVKFEDGSTGDGWGPAMRKITITYGTEPVYTPILASAEAYVDTPMRYVSRNTNKGVTILDPSSFPWTIPLHFFP